MTTSNTEFTGQTEKTCVTLDKGVEHLITGESGTPLPYGEAMRKACAFFDLVDEAGVRPVLRVSLYSEETDEPQDDAPTWDVMLLSTPVMVPEGKPMTAWVTVANGNTFTQGKMSIMPSGQASLEIHG